MPDANTKHFQCRHIFADGHRCGSKCLRSENFCFYHYRSHKPRILPGYTDTLSCFELPALEDRSAIQAAITLIAQRVASGNLDSKRAGLLLYAAQIASLNLPRPNPSDSPRDPITETELDETGVLIAPIHEILPKPQEKSIHQLINEKWERECQEEDEAEKKAALVLLFLKKQAAEQDFQLPEILPNLLAAEEAAPAQPAPAQPAPAQPARRPLSLHRVASGLRLSGRTASIVLYLTSAPASPTFNPVLITPLDLQNEPLEFREEIAAGAIDYAADTRQAGPLPVEGKADLIVEHRGPAETVDDIRVRAAYSGEFEVLCARCLDPVAVPLQGDFDLIFRPEDADAEAGERSITEDETEIGYYGKSGLLLEDVVREQVLLALPGRTLCREDCKGLCVHCGQNLNLASCNCAKQADSHDPRWTALEGLALKQ